MRFKYYLRGLGIGILITTIILSISFAMKQPELSDAEIIERAEALGMVMADTEQVLPSSEIEADTAKDTLGQDTEIQTDGQTDDNHTQPEDGINNTQITQTQFTVEVGDSSNAVAQKLAELGLVDNAEAFNQYMVDNNYANYVLPGTIAIDTGATYEQIANQLVDKTLHR